MNSEHWVKEFWEKIFQLLLHQKAVVEKEIPQGVQTDLFGNILKQKAKNQKLEAKMKITSGGIGLTAIDKNINNTPHKYEAVTDEKAIKKLIAELKKHDEICFDTETTGIDANDAELVGLKFFCETGRSILCSLPC